MARKIVITSGKGGVGKTTIVSALGVAFARLGAKVLLVDMDFGLNNLDILMNDIFTKATSYGLIPNEDQLTCDSLFGIYYILHLAKEKANITP